MSQKQSPRDRVLAELAEARETVHAALSDVDPKEVDTAITPGKWSVRENVLHLCFWDRETLSALALVIRGDEPPWAHLPADQMDRFNVNGVEELRHLPWADTRRYLETLRQRLLVALADVPADPAEVWANDHPLGALLLDLATNDRHHAEIIARRTRR